MPEVVTHCPSCKANLKATRLTCKSCGLQLEGEFEFSALMHIQKEDLQFVLEFIRASGNLKKLSKIFNQSYPTIRNRLDEIISRLDDDKRSRSERRHAILDLVSRGDLSAKEAAEKLSEISE